MPSTRRNPLPDTNRHDQRLAEILQHATEAFCDKGFAAASMRDLSRATGMSLAGLYHYFDSKEKLLYLVQKHTFETILQRAQMQLAGVRDPEHCLRVFIRNHLEYFLANEKGMKVLAHEDGVLGGEYGDEVRTIKRRYYMLCCELVDDLKQERNLQFSTKLAVLSLFGMMNWIYTWHNPVVDGDALELARHMGDMFLRGVIGVSGTETIFAEPSVRSGAETPSRRISEEVKKKVSEVSEVSKVSRKEHPHPTLRSGWGTRSTSHNSS
jgi:TetR/AcrR family transcriptional regulator, cholesterol catabolism regulator